MARIVHFSHENPALWGALGPLVTSRAVVKALGGPVYSDERTRWFVAFEESASSAGLGCVAGFAALILPAVKDRHHFFTDAVDRGLARVDALAEVAKRPRPAVLDYALVLPAYRGRGIYGELQAARLEAYPGPFRCAVREERWHHYAARSWQKTSQRGSWVYAELG